jgi:hypothetical protein
MTFASWRSSLLLRFTLSLGRCIALPRFLLFRLASFQRTPQSKDLEGLPIGFADFEFKSFPGISNGLRLLSLIHHVLLGNLVLHL